MTCKISSSLEGFFHVPHLFVHAERSERNAHLKHERRESLSVGPSKRETEPVDFGRNTLPNKNLLETLGSSSIYSSISPPKKTSCSFLFVPNTCSFFSRSSSLGPQDLFITPRGPQHRPTPAKRAPPRCGASYGATLRPSAVRPTTATLSTGAPVGAGGAYGWAGRGFWFAPSGPAGRQSVRSRIRLGMDYEESV